MGIIYCYTNKVTGKKYIGQTINPDQRKRNHLHEATKRNSNHYFHRSIRKHGWENFDYEVIEETDNLSERETYYIKTMDTHWPNGYNELIDHIGMTNSVRKKISETKKRRFASMTKDERKELTKSLCESNKGSKKSAESKKKTSESLKKYLSENPRPKRIWTQEMKDRQSQMLKDKYKEGIGRWVK